MPSPETCLITGTLYDSEGVAAEDSPNARAYIRVRQVVKDNQLIQKRAIDYPAEDDGAVSFSIVRGSTAQIEGTAVGWNTPKWYTIPDAPTTTLEELQDVVTPPANAVTAATFNAHVSKLANPDDPGHITNVAGGGITLADGVLTVSPVSQEIVQDYLSAFFNSQTPALSFAYNDAQNRVEATIAAATTLQAGLMSAPDKAALDAIPATYQPLDSDLTAFAALAPPNDDLLQRKGGAWTNRTPAQVKTDLALVKADVGLGSVDNTSDAAKPVSAAQQAALDLKQNLLINSAGLRAALSDETGTGAAVFANSPALVTPTGIVKGDVGLGNVDNTADAAKSVATAAALTTPRAIDGQSFDGTADVAVVAPATHAATSKATPVDADELPLVDSAASNVLKRLTWANLKATLKTYFDTLYQAALTFTGAGDVVRQTSPTIVTPTIASFANAAHDHTNAAGGGTLSSAAVGLGNVLNVVQSRVLHVAYSGANTGTSETDLASYTLPAGTLDADGKTLEIIAWGTTAANGNAKSAKVYFGATEIARPMNNLTTSGVSWNITSCHVIRTGAATQNSRARTSSGVPTLGTNENTNGLFTASPAETLSGTVVIRVTGLSNTASNDVLLKGFIVRILN